MSVVKNGIAGAGGEDDHPALFHVPLRPAANIRLADRGHRDGGLHAGRALELFQRRLHGERVHHGRQHTHEVGLSAVHAGRRPGDATEDVAAADDDRDLNAHRNDRLDVVRQSRRPFRCPDRTRAGPSTLPRTVSAEHACRRLAVSCDSLWDPLEAMENGGTLVIPPVPNKPRWDVWWQEATSVTRSRSMRMGP